MSRPRLALFRHWDDEEPVSTHRTLEEARQAAAALGPTASIGLLEGERAGGQAVGSPTDFGTSATIAPCRRGRLPIFGVADRDRRDLQRP